MNKIGVGILNAARVRTEEAYAYRYKQQYSNNPVQQRASVIEGYFQQEDLVKAMAIRKVNKTLCGLLGILVVTAFVSYYFAMNCELTLNTLSRQITTLNDENAELQNNLDRLKSFNNVDTKMIQRNLLQKAEKVMEVPAVSSVESVEKQPAKSAPFNWLIGY